jgi:hypothetical protein
MKGNILQYKIRLEAKLPIFNLKFVKKKIEINVAERIIHGFTSLRYYTNSILNRITSFVSLSLHLFIKYFNANE